VHVLVKEWHHIPLGHTVLAGPQAHVAQKASGCEPNSLSPWRAIPEEKVAAACADPTDMVVASNARAKVLSIGSSL
jgi:hypothetical protein